ncbi:hypothetical protein Q4Q39_11780 [Flavivirga amylovorans]|uniref:Uncharacterized protein n=1 Tax=Flavivirga amylovorans TaxID=870486 RepID=A0ABT8X2F1_9FLAO|nr:hypothetical protein [Flavivirga amylovorans]MDO5988085.1 hypothetical protein [Flavivirga amylovorans]
MINPKEKYFLTSFRYNKNKPEDFGLKPDSENDCFKDKDGVRWKAEQMWDEGWGDEYGFVRLPLLSPDELWLLLLESNIDENKRGAAEFLDRLYPFELKTKLKELFKGKDKLNRNLTKRLSNLEVLRTGTNRDEVTGKSYEEVTKDYQDWKSLKDDFERMRTESIWKELKKL